MPNWDRLPTWEEVQRSGQMYRGMPKKHYAPPFGQGKSWSNPEPFYKLNTNQYNIPFTLNQMSPFTSNQMSPSIGDSFRNMEQYRMPSSNSLTPLSPSGIDNFNKQNWLQPAPDWNSGMKNWR